MAELLAVRKSEKVIFLVQVIGLQILPFKTATRLMSYLF